MLGGPRPEGVWKSTTTHTWFDFDRGRFYWAPDDNIGSFQLDWDETTGSGLIRWTERKRGQKGGGATGGKKHLRLLDNGTLELHAVSGPASHKWQVLVPVPPEERSRLKGWPG